MRETLEELFTAYERDVYAYMLRMFGVPHEAEDLTQETFFRACKGAVRFRGDSSVRTWLFGIARNVSLEHMRRPAALPIDAIDVATVPHDPTDAVFLQQALSKLSFEDREVVMLADVLGFSGPDLAVTLDVSAEAARVRLHRARRRLRDVIETTMRGEEHG